MRLHSTRQRSATAYAGLLALLVSLFAVLAFPPGAMASKCGNQVLADWYDNGRIDRLYPLHCYEDAIDSLPEEILIYANADEVISRALQSALRGKLTLGGCDPSPDGDADDCRGIATGNNGSNGPGSNGDSSGEPGDGSSATPDVDTSSGISSVPIPLLVLGGMSLALLAAGGLGYLSRRRHAVEGVDDGPIGPDDPTLGA